MARIFLVGYAGHAGVILDIVEKEGRNNVIGIIDSFAAPGTPALGMRILGNESDLPGLAAEHRVEAAVVAIGDNFTRHTVVTRIRAVAPDFGFVTAVHPSAQIGRGVRIGEGTVVMAGAVINPNSVIGEHCIVNTGSSIDHDNVIGRFSSMAPRAVTGGDVRIGEFTAVSLAAAILHGRTVGCHAVIGAAATVLHDVPDFAVAYGTPARVQRLRKPGDKYL